MRKDTPSTRPSASALPAVSPSNIRDQLTEMVIKDLLGPAGGPEEELDQREDRVRERYLVGMLAPKSTRVEAGGMDELGSSETTDGGCDVDPTPSCRRIHQHRKRQI